MLEAKARLAGEVMTAGGEGWITELDNDELLDLFRLGLSPEVDDED
jgi:non-specific serine/threonine protein kinase